MIRNVLSHIDGVALYGIVSILLFFTFFLGTLVWVFRLKAADLEAMRALPLHDAEPGPDATPNSQPTVTSSSSRSRHECE